MRKVVVALGGLVAGLVFLTGCQLLWAGSGEEEPPVLHPVGLQFAYSDAGAEPGVVRAHLDSPPGEVAIYTRAVGQLSSFCFHPGAPKLYFLSRNENTIWRADYINGTWYEEFPVYQHQTYVRCVRFVHDEAGQHPDNPADEWHLFFSEATGAGGDGVIYRIVGRSVETYYTVELDDVDGFWAGWFGFSPDGTLYLASGNRTGAGLYRVSDSGVQRVYQAGGAIAGFVFLSETTLLYADWEQNVYFLDLDEGEADLIFTWEEAEHVSDADLLPGWWLGETG